MGGQGYRVVKGTDNYGHSFGGTSWDTPVCPNCNINMHLIFTFDLSDPRFQQFHHHSSLDSIPLLSCLNCSSYWSRQVFELAPTSRSVSIVKQFDEEKWICEEEDRLPSPLPFSNMMLVELEENDLVLKGSDTDHAFDAFGSEYVCRVLGEPLFAVDPIQKKCDGCNQEMEYLATVCSEDYDSVGLVKEDFSFQIGESYIYFHFCKICNVLETETQST
ncbi:rRNA methylase [Tumebacillus avium]|uniref:rRNA methylase n=1 Tax=Tumebacillus avium TaxID=1903704 RepID=A0A1Y0IW28_9BACL|nr:rRNA methylase [Tumebacillus avium]ARU63593.1 rRNA methylase [Tumebacillus avium]